MFDPNITFKFALKVIKSLQKVEFFWSNVMEIGVTIPVSFESVFEANEVIPVKVLES